MYFSFPCAIIQAEFTYSGSKMRAIDINLSAVGALLLSIVREPPVTLFAERQNGIILDLHKAMELIHARLIRKGTCVDGDKCDYAICGDKDEYASAHPEYRDEAGFRRNK